MPKLLHLCLFLVMSLGVVLTGCSRDTRPYEDHSRDSQRYAMNVKQMVYDAVTDATRAREPADILWPLVLELEQTDRPHGEFAQILAELRQQISELHKSCEQSPNGRPADLQNRLQGLIALADKLPGEVQAGSRPMQD